MKRYRHTFEKGYELKLNSKELLINVLKIYLS